MIAAPTHLMTLTCRIERPVRVRDEYGGATETYDVVAADVPCRWSSPRAGEGVEAGGVTGRFDGALYVGGSVDVRQDDRVLVGTQTFDVGGVQKFGDPARPIFQRIDVSEATPDAGD